MSFKIGKHFEVFRSTETIDAGERIPIILGIGRAFGSGDHETTSSCLEELENIPIIRDAKVLDVGCGTGILSIAAAKMGARQVTAVDPAPEAIKVTRKSIQLNHLEKKVIPLEGELEIVEDHDFDVIMSNLYGDILLELVKDLDARLKPNGYLLLSGILYEYTYDLKRVLMQTGFDLLKARYLEEYTTLLSRKRT
ncbi:MAG: 50S ribosomal protein L11 methyltransferase [Candidatus Aminicenantes bacterium]|nr:MAG: 50S ribosomal protein L11 methyltransferase [Candidatus Aminicenantes bacterium]